MTNKDLARALVDKGLTYQAVGEVLGVSRQRIHQLLTDRVGYKNSLGKKVVYPNLLEWSIKNKCNRDNLLRSMGYAVEAKNKAMLVRVLTGKQLPKKDFIDKLIHATKLPYEKLFEVFQDGD